MDDGYRTITIRSAWSHYGQTDLHVRARPFSKQEESAGRCYMAVSSSGFDMRLDLTPDQAREIAAMLWNVAGVQEQANGVTPVAEAA